MPPVVVGLRVDNSQYLAGLSQADAAMLRLGQSTQQFGSISKAVFATASFTGLSALSVGVQRISADMDELIKRYNTLAGLDKATNFFNTRRELAALAAGAGDVATQAQNASVAIRFLAAGANFSPGQYTQIGQLVRGQVLAGIADTDRGYQAALSYIVGGRSQMEHMLGVMVSTPQAYREYAQQNNLNRFSLTPDQQMVARMNELQNTTSAINKGAFGSATQATAFQTLDTFMGNVSDYRIRSVAGSIEELARAMGLLNASTGVDRAQQIGQALGVVQAGGTFGTIALGAGMYRGWQAGQIALRGAPLRAAYTTTQGQVAGVGSALDALAPAEITAATLAQQMGYSGTLHFPDRMVANPAFTPEIAAQRTGLLGKQTELGALATLQEEGIAANTAMMASASVLPTAIMGIAAVVGVAATAWTVYSNAVRSAREAQEQVGQAGRTGIEAGYQLTQMASGGATPAGMLEYAKTSGLNAPSLQRLKTAMASPSFKADKFPELLGHLMVTQQQLANNAKLDWVGLSPRGEEAFWHGLNPFAPEFLNPDKLRQRADAAEQYQYDVVAGQARSYVQSQKTTKASNANMDWFNLQKDNQRRLAAAKLLDTTAAQMGFTGDVKYAQQEQMSIWHSYLNFDTSQLRGKDLTEAQGLQGQSARGIIGQQIKQKADEAQRIKDEEVKAMQKRLDQAKLDQQADMQIARQKDQMLGANVQLLRETNQQSTALKNANEIEALYADAVKTGHTAMFTRTIGMKALTDAERLLTDAQLDFAGGLREARRNIIGGIPGMYSGALGLAQAQGGGQASIGKALAGKNSLLGGALGALGEAQAVQPQFAEYGVQNDLLSAMRAIDAGASPSKFAGQFSRGMMQYLNQFAAKAPGARQTEIAAQSSSVLGLRSSLITATSGAEAGLLNWQSSMQGLPNTPQTYADLRQLQASGAIPDLQTAAGVLAYIGGQVGSAGNPLFMQHEGGILSGGMAAAPGIISNQRQGLDATVNSQIALIGSLDTLTGAVQALTVIMGGHAAGAAGGMAALAAGDVGLGADFPAFAAGQSGVVTTSPSSLMMGATAPDIVLPPGAKGVSGAPWHAIAAFGIAHGFKVTSTTGGRHNTGSLHYKGMAVDFGVRGKSPKEVQQFIVDARAAGYHVIDERSRPAGQKIWGGPNIHVDTSSMVAAQAVMLPSGEVLVPSMGAMHAMAVGGITGSPFGPQGTLGRTTISLDSLPVTPYMEHFYTNVPGYPTANPAYNGIVPYPSGGMAGVANSMVGAWNYKYPSNFGFQGTGRIWTNMGGNQWRDSAGKIKVFPNGVDPNAQTGGSGLGAYSIESAGGTGGEAPAKQQKSMYDMIAGNLAGLPVSAYSSGKGFLQGGGLDAILGPLTGGNPLMGIGIKLLEAQLFGHDKQKVAKPVPVAIVEVKDTAMDVFTLSNSRNAYSDTFSRRQLIARPMLYPRGS